MGIVLKPEKQEAEGFIRADTTGFQAKCLSQESSWLLLTFLRQEINKWAEFEKQIMLPLPWGTLRNCRGRRGIPEEARKNRGHR